MSRGGRETAGDPPGMLKEGAVGRPEAFSGGCWAAEPEKPAREVKGKAADPRFMHKLLGRAPLRGGIGDAASKAS